MSRSQLPAASFIDPEASCGVPGFLETSEPKEEDYHLFRLIEIKHSDLGFATPPFGPHSKHFSCFSSFFSVFFFFCIF